MPENVNQEDNPEKEPTLVPPLPKWELDRLIRVELKIENLSEGYRELKQDINDNTKAIDRLVAVVDVQRKSMEEKFADQRKYTDDKLAVLQKSMEGKFADQRKYTDDKFADQRKYSDDKFAAVVKSFENVKNWIMGFISACAVGILVLLIRSGFRF
jgi:hypothetical protein